MKTKLILTLSKDLEDKVFTDLWQSKYSSLGTMEITSKELAKELVIKNAPISTITGQEKGELPSMVDFTQRAKTLSLNDFTNELIILHPGYIRTIETQSIQETETQEKKTDES